MIEVQSLVKRFGETPAVDGVSFSIRPGEAFGLLGPNGAGKTTIMLMMVGALRPDAGQVLIDGVTDPTRPEARRLIGVAPQSLAIYEELSGAENLAFFAKLYGLGGSELDDAVERGLELSGLADRRKQRAGTYSGGMKRRLNLACALVHKPRVLLCDEPTVGVDPQSRNHIFDSIERLKAEGCTLIYTTHYMEEAERLCDRVAIMDAGKILALDTVKALVAAHGGSSVVEAELSSDSDHMSQLTQLGGQIDGTRLRLTTDHPLESIAALGKTGVEINELHVERPNLEGVFLHLTGRSLRD